MPVPRIYLETNFVIADGWRQQPRPGGVGRPRLSNEEWLLRRAERQRLELLLPSVAAVEAIHTAQEHRRAVAQQISAVTAQHLNDLRRNHLPNHEEAHKAITTAMDQWAIAADAWGPSIDRTLQRLSLCATLIDFTPAHLADARTFEAQGVSGAYDALVLAAVVANVGPGPIPPTLAPAASRYFFTSDKTLATFARTVIKARSLQLTVFTDLMMLRARLQNHDAVS